MLLVGQGGDHLTSSMIYHSSTVTCIPNTLIGGSTISGTTIYGSTAVCSPVGKFTSCIDAGTGYFSGNVNVTVANTPEVLLTHSNTSKTFLMAVDGGNAFFRANSTNNILFQYAGGTNALSINGSNGAACFSSTVCTPYVSTNTIEVGGSATSPTTACIGYGMFGYSGVGLAISSGATGPNQGIGFFVCGIERGRWITSGNLGELLTQVEDYKLKPQGQQVVQMPYI
jgi:hypothetical protein